MKFGVVRLCSLLLMHKDTYKSILRRSRSYNCSGNRPFYLRAHNKQTNNKRTTAVQTRGDILTSTKGSTIQRVRKLLQKSKFRHEEGLVVVENPKLIADVYKHRRSLIRQILVDSKRWDDEASGEWSFLADAGSTSDSSIEIIRVAPDVLKTCSDTITHQGMLAVCDMPRHLTGASSSHDNPLTLILDGVADPGNLGTLIRSSAATQVKEILLLPGSCDPWNPKAIRSAAATTFLIPTRFMNHDEWHSYVTQCGDATVDIYAATMEGTIVTSSTAHFDIDWSLQGRNYSLILGNEGAGLSPRILDLINSGDVKGVHVPMMNDAVESLNVAVCGSIILFERSRQLKNSKNDMK